jgi:hypothetical protein
MPKIQRKEIMIGLHITIDVDDGVSEESISVLADSLRETYEALAMPGGVTGVTIEEIRGGESTGTLADWAVSSTPETWPEGALLSCIKPTQEGEATLRPTLYVNKGYDPETNTVIVYHILPRVRVSADRFVYVTSPRKSAKNGASS